MDLILPTPMTYRQYEQQRRTEASHFQLNIGVRQLYMKNVLPKLVEEYRGHADGVLQIIDIKELFYEQYI